MSDQSFLATNVQLVVISTTRKRKVLKWEDLPDDYTCPICGVGKDMFQKLPDEKKPAKKAPEKKKGK